MILLRYCFSILSPVRFFLLLSFFFFLFFCITLADFWNLISRLLLFPVPFAHMCDMYQRIVTTYSHRLFVYNMYIIYMYLYIYIYNTFFSAPHMRVCIFPPFYVYYVHALYTYVFLYIPSVPSIPFLFFQFLVQFYFFLSRKSRRRDRILLFFNI